MWETFEEFLRAFGIDPEQLKGKEREVMQKMYDTFKRRESEAAAEGHKAEERFQAILNTARAACATGTDHVRAELLSYASELASKRESSVDEAQRKIVEKAAELAKTPDTSRTATADEQRAEAALPADSNAVLSRSEIVSAFTDHGHERSVVRRAARSVVEHMEHGDEIDMRGLLEDLRKKDTEGNRGLLRLHVEDGGSPAVRAVTASSINVAIQSVLTYLLNKQYSVRPPVSDDLVTTIPSTAAEDTLPEVETEEGVRRVKEGEPYPLMSGTERSVKVGYFKWGAAIAQTRENSVFDRLGRVQVLLTSLARQLRRKRDEFRLARICDSTAIDGRYIARPGDDNGAAAFYSTTADTRGNVNLVESNGLADETDIDAAIAALDAMQLKDDSFVMPELRVVLVHSTKKATAWKILNSVFAPSAVAATGQPNMPNPYGPGGLLSEMPRVIAHPLVGTYAGAATTWFAGDPAQQFYEKEVWPVEVVPKMAAGEMALRDIVGLWIGSFCADMVALSNMFFVKCTA